MEGFWLGRKNKTCPRAWGGSSMLKHASGGGMAWYCIPQNHPTGFIRFWPGSGSKAFLVPFGSGPFPVPRRFSFHSVLARFRFAFGYGPLPVLSRSGFIWYRRRHRAKTKKKRNGTFPKRVFLKHRPGFTSINVEKHQSMSKTCRVSMWVRGKPSKQKQCWE